MMIQRFAVVILVAAFGASAQAVELNKDALKAMQQQGHQIAQGARQYKVQNNLCLDTASEGLVVKTCSADAATQKWHFDDQGRLVAHSGKCVAGARLANCDGNAPKWTYDSTKRLANPAGQCLQVQGTSPRNGATVTTAACSNAAVQIWQ